MRSVRLMPTHRRYFDPILEQGQRRHVYAEHMADVMNHVIVAIASWIEARAQHIARSFDEMHGA